MKKCILDETKPCTNCGACERCDLDPNKICDNCCKCIEHSSQDYAEISIFDIVTEQPESYMAELEAIEQEGEGEEPIPYAQIDPTLLAQWEQRLKDVDNPQEIKPMRGTRPKRRR